jgi:hypothetical protein
MNLVLGDVVETIYVVDEDDEDEDIKVSDDTAAQYVIANAHLINRPSRRSRKCYSSEVCGYTRHTVEQGSQWLTLHYRRQCRFSLPSGLIMSYQHSNYIRLHHA